MRVYWHNGELAFKAETTAEGTALHKLREFFGGIGFPLEDDGLFPLEKELGRPLPELEPAQPLGHVVDMNEVNARIDGGNN